MEEDQMVLDNIDEFVNDEMKIVTYKWLSLSLSIHVTKARCLLEEYLKISENELDVIYFVGGRKKEGLYTTYRYKLARQNSLDDVKSTFDEVTTCHIYSIQKSRIKDTDILYANDVDIVKENLSSINKYSAIQCESIDNLEETTIKRIQHVPQVNGVHKQQDIVEKIEVQKPKNVEAKPQSKEKNPKKETTTTTKSFFGSGTKKTKDSKGARATVLKEGNLLRQEQPNKVTAKDKEIGNAKDKPTTKTKTETRDISSAFSKSKKGPSITPAEKTIAIDIDPNDDDKVVPTEDDGDTHEKNKKEKRNKEHSNENEDIDVPRKEEILKEKTKRRKVVISDSENEDMDVPRKEEKTKKGKEEHHSNENDKMDVPRKEEKSKGKTKKRKEEPKSNEIDDMDVPPKEENLTEKTKKRKAVISDSESDDGNFESFLSKSKDPTYKSPEKKASKKKEKSKLVSEDEVEIFEPTPEPVKKKTKRRKTEKKEPSKSKEDAKVSKKESTSTKTDEDEKEENKSAGGKRRGRRVVLKSKQYLDATGFMVTKKEYESESFSEESDTEMTEEKMKTLSPVRKKEVEKKKIALDLEKKTKAHLKKPKNQSSLMSFFKPK